MRMMMVVAACLSLGLPMGAQSIDKEGFHIKGRKGDVHSEVRPAKAVNPKDLHQPEALAASLKALQTGTLEERVQALKEKTLRDVVFVKGGRFLMGDFGSVFNESGLPDTFDRDNKPPFWVGLDSYSLGTYKVTFAEFDVYTDATGQPRIFPPPDMTKWDLATEADKAESLKEHADLRNPLHAAMVFWPQAKAYCAWLAQLTGLPIDLPLEAQWEYAARNRGHFVVYPTDNGHCEKGRNTPDREQLIALTGKSGGLPYPIALFPPNPLGLYGLAEGGLEWMEDWHEPYPEQKAIVKNPRGPERGEKKVMRGGNGYTHEDITMTTERYTMEPERERLLYRLTFRFAVHQASPVRRKGSPVRGKSSSR